MELPRLMVVAGFPPEGGGGGGVILRNILQDYPCDRLQWCALMPDLTLAESWWRPEIPRRGSRFYLRGKHRPGMRHVWRWLGHRLETLLSTRSAIEAEAEFRPEVIWAVLDYHVILALESFTQRCQRPFHVSVHDDPEISARLCKYPVPTARIEEAFKTCFSRARSRDCISQRLSDRYRKRFGLDSFVLTRSLDRVVFEPRRLDRGTAIRIVMGGITDELPPPWPTNILSAIEGLSGALGRPAEFHVFGQPLGSPSECVRFHPRLPEPEFDRLLNGMHVGYACDPLTETGRHFAATSFPTKIVTYIGAGLPFLYHGPSDSTVGDFLNTYKAGVIVEDQSSDALTKALHYILENYSSMSHQCQRAAQECFEGRALRKRLFDALKRDARSVH